MTQDFIRNNKRAIGAMLIIGLVILVLLIIKSTSFNPVNPASRPSEDSRAGVDYALVYEYGEFYDLTSEDAVLRDLQYDLALYGKTFYEYFRDENNLIGFTFKNGTKKINDTTYEFSGKFYGVPNDVTLTAQKLNDKLLRVSIADNNQSSIDEKLRLNGAFSRLAEKLPIDEVNYSIRYLPDNSEVVVTFYQGYQIADVDAAQAKLTEILQTNPDSFNINYYVNARGKYSIGDIRTYQPTLTQNP